MARNKLEPVTPLGVFASSPDLPNNPEAWCRQYGVSLDNSFGDSSAACAATLPTGQRIYLNVKGDNWTHALSTLRACVDALGAKPRSPAPHDPGVHRCRPPQ